MAQPVTTPRLYAGVKRARDLVFVPGQLPLDDEVIVQPGREGVDVTVDQARETAAPAAGHCLDVIREELGSLDAIDEMVRIAGYVPLGDHPVDIPDAIDAVSATILDVLGDKGEHARPASGVAALPLNACVEVEMMVPC